jgi:hypothetical protein
MSVAYGLAISAAAGLEPPLLGGEHGDEFGDELGGGGGTTRCGGVARPPTASRLAPLIARLRGDGDGGGGPGGDGGGHGGGGGGGGGGGHRGHSGGAAAQLERCVAAFAQAQELLGAAEREPALWRQAEVEGARMLVAWAAHLEEYPAEPPPAAGGAADAHFGAEAGEEGAAVSMLREAAARLERSGRAAAAGDVHYRLGAQLCVRYVRRSTPTSLAQEAQHAAWADAAAAAAGEEPHGSRSPRGEAAECTRMARELEQARLMRGRARVRVRGRGEG